MGRRTGLGGSLLTGADPSEPGPPGAAPLGSGLGRLALRGGALREEDCPPGGPRGVFTAPCRQRKGGSPWGVSDSRGHPGVLSPGLSTRGRLSCRSCLYCCRLRALGLSGGSSPAACTPPGGGGGGASTGAAPASAGRLASCSGSSSSSSSGSSGSPSPKRKRFRPRRSESSSGSSSSSGSRSPRRRYHFTVSRSRSSGSRSWSRSRSPRSHRRRWGAELHSGSREARRLQRRRETRLHKLKAIDERRVVYVGRIRRTMTHDELRERFSLIGDVEGVSLHFRERSDSYGFVTFLHMEDAFAAIENGGKLRRPDERPFDLCFGGRRQFCKSDYADLDSTKDDEAGGRFEDLDFDSLLKQAQKGAES